jgi:hypothetical protein
MSITDASSWRQSFQMLHLELHQLLELLYGLM